MKERMLDVIKWGLIMIISGAVFYVVCPKYYFTTLDNFYPIYKCNKITGQVLSTEDVAKKEPKETSRNLSENKKTKDRDIFDRIAEERARKKLDSLGILSDEELEGPRKEARKKLLGFPDQPEPSPHEKRFK